MALTSQPGTRWPHALRLVRYATVSAIATLVGMFTLGVLVTFTSLPAAWANVVAMAVGAVPSFELNRRWVWSRRDRRSLSRQVLPFLCLALVELAASTAAVDAAAGWATDHRVGHLTRTLIVETANVIALGTLWVIQYLVCDRMLFRSQGTGRNPKASDFHQEPCGNKDHRTPSMSTADGKDT